MRYFYSKVCTLFHNYFTLENLINFFKLFYSAPEDLVNKPVKCIGFYE